MEQNIFRLPKNDLLQYIWEVFELTFSHYEYLNIWKADMAFTNISKSQSFDCSVQAVVSKTNLSEACPSRGRLEDSVLLFGS